MSTHKKAHVLSPIHLGNQRIEPGAIVELREREFAHLFRNGAVEPIEVYQARKNAESISAKARAEAERLYAEVMAKAATDADETATAQEVERPEPFDPKRAAEERREASKRARAATPSS